MKKTIYIVLFSLLGVAVLSSCEDKLVDELRDTVTSGGVLRNVGETNNLDASDMSSTYSIVLEAQDAQQGALLSEVRVNVGFQDNDDAGAGDVALTQFTTIAASSFNETSPTTNGLPVATFSASLSELMAHVGTSLADITLNDPADEDDDGSADAFIIDFEMVLNDGRVFNLGNATNDVTRSGRFSYFNSQFRYFPTVSE